MDPITTAGLSILNLAVVFGVLCAAIVAVEVAAAWLQRKRIVGRRVRFGAPKALELPARRSVGDC